MISDTDFLVFLTLNMWPSLAAQLVRRTMSRSVGAILAVLWIRMPVYEGSMPNLGDVYTTMPPLRCSQWFYVFVESPPAS